MVRDQDVAAKSIDDRIYDVIDEDKSDILYIAAVHGEGVAAVVINISNCLVSLLSLSFCKNNTCCIHLIDAEVLHLRLTIRVVVSCLVNFCFWEYECERVGADL